MPRKVSEQPARPPNLTRPREEAAQTITVQINKGLGLLDLAISSQAELDRARAERSKWSKYNAELLTRLFDNTSIVDEYNRGPSLFSIPMNPSLQEMASDFRDNMQTSITKLEAILERLELIPEPAELRAAQAAAAHQPISTDVFLVHGHDELAKTTVARFIEQLKLRVVILHEQVDAGQTIIEKLERHSQEAGFAVVLLTPDDVGAPRDRRDEARPRARQNVVLELGYFIGKLGRARVCVLHKGDIELPSDYHGVLYVPMDDGSWQLRLAHEMRHAGLPVDLNDV